MSEGPSKLFEVFKRHGGKIALLAGAAAVDQYGFNGAGRHAIGDKLSEYKKDTSAIGRDFKGVTEAGSDVFEGLKTAFQGIKGEPGAWDKFFNSDGDKGPLLGRMASAIIPGVLGFLLGQKMGGGAGTGLAVAGAFVFAWKTFLEDRVIGGLSSGFDKVSKSDPLSIISGSPGAPPTVEAYVPQYEPGV